MYRKYFVESDRDMGTGKRERSDRKKMRDSHQLCAIDHRSRSAAHATIAAIAAAAVAAAAAAAALLLRKPVAHFREAALIVVPALDDAVRRRDEPRAPVEVEPMGPTVLCYVGFKGAKKDARRGVVECTYEAAAQVKDHKKAKDESMGGAIS